MAAMIPNTKRLSIWLSTLAKPAQSVLQRRLSVGYARAARLIDTMEEQGIVGPANGARPREVLIDSMDEYGISDNDEL